MSQYEENEFQGILVNSDFKAITKQEKKKTTAMETVGVEGLELDLVIDILLKSGVITKTKNGKYRVTKKARQKQLKGFKIARK
jgi:predicted transcriptional regulator